MGGGRYSLVFASLLLTAGTIGDRPPERVLEDHRPRGERRRGGDDEEPPASPQHPQAAAPAVDGGGGPRPPSGWNTILLWASEQEVGPTVP